MTELTKNAKPLTFRVIDFLWLMVVIVLTIVCWTKDATNRYLQKEMAKHLADRDKFLHELAQSGERLPITLLKGPIAQSSKLGLLVICNGDIEAAKYLIDAGIQLRTTSNRSDGIEACFFSNSPKLLELVLLSRQWKPCDVTPYLDFLDEHSYVASGKDSDHKNNEYKRNKESIRKLLEEFASSGTVFGQPVEIQ
jgi:hypothetical protein